MSRLLFHCVSVGALLSVAVQAQCLAAPTGTSILPGLVQWSSGSSYTSTFTYDDEGITNPPIALGFVFPMAGAVGALDQMWVNSNGEVYLTDSSLALTQPVGGATYGADSYDECRGSIAGASARIVVLGDDQENSIASGASWDIRVDQTTPGQVRVTWIDMARFVNTTDRYTFSCTIFSSGVVMMEYDAAIGGLTDTRAVGISIGNQVTGVSLNLTGGANSGSSGLLYELFGASNPFDLNGRTMMIVPNGQGGFQSAILCEPANHSTYGVGCYNLPGTAYQFFANAAAASPALTGNALFYILAGNSYVLSWVPGGAAAFIPPSGGATSFANVDDGSTVLTPSVPMTIVGGTSAQLAVSHNGHVTTAATANHGSDWTPTGAEVATASNQNRAFYSWHDYNNNEAGSGPIQWEELAVGPDQVLCVTWNGVENYPTSVVNPSTMQMQINLTTGNVLILWVAVDTDTTPTTGTAHLIGFSGPGPSIDPGSTDFSLNTVIVPDVGVTPPTLSASPAPIFTLGGSSVPMTWTASNLRDASPNAPGLYIGLLMFSVNPPIFGTGIDLALIGVDAPGCTLLIGSLDVTLGLTDLSSTIAQPIQFPQPLNPGDTFYSQVANFVVPNTLPGGLNNFGLIVTNGVRSVFHLQ